MNEHSFYTIEEAIKILKVSRITLHRKLKGGDIPFVKLGKRVLIPECFFLHLAQSAFSNNRDTGEEKSNG